MASSLALHLVLFLQVTSPLSDDLELPLGEFASLRFALLRFTLLCFANDWLIVVFDCCHGRVSWLIVLSLVVSAITMDGTVPVTLLIELGPDFR